MASHIDEVLARTIAIDMHNHVYPEGTEPHPRRGPGGPGGPGGSDAPGGRGPGGPPEAAPDAPAGTLSLGDALERSGLSAVCASFVLDFAPSERPGDAWAALLAWMKAIDAELAASQRSRALTVADLHAAHEQGRPTIIQTVEGAMFIEGNLDRLEQAFRFGLRHLQLFHEQDDKVSPLGDVNTRPGHLGGLTATGADVIRACNRIGILVDLAHASHDTVAGAIAVATKPLVISHTSLDTFGSGDRMYEMMKPRLISGEHAKAVADAGGVVGVWTHMARSLPELVQSIRAMVGAVGIEHVGIGTDTDLLSSRGTNFLWPDRPSFVRAVVEEMLRQGISANDITKVCGGNYLRVFGEAVG